MIWENMELPQPRTFGDEGRKTTHDFLSLYSPAQQDPSPSQGSYLKTHDFLQPLEGATKNLEVSAVERPPNPHPSVTHILPGGIGTYSISYCEKRAPKQEGTVSTVAQASSTERNDENSNCSSYSGSGFTLWEESSSTKGKTGKENIVVEEIVVKKEAPNFEGKSADQTPSTPRSKHSATEQRRRCKINDRFHKLREILPHGDQKRDKASFLLEVIEYIQHLQEKVHRYEARTKSSGVVFDINKPVPQQLQPHFQPRLFASSGGEISDQKLKEQEQQSIERGRIGISSVYSQQLLNSLTQALQHSGVDLSQASVAVQIDLGKRAKRGIHPSISSSNDMMCPQDDISMSNKAGSRSLTTQTREESDQALQKRLKTSRS